MSKGNFIVALSGALCLSAVGVADAANWPSYPWESPDCPSWAVCEGVPGAGTTAQFRAWVHAEVGVPQPTELYDIDVDGVLDPLGSLVTDDNLVIRGSVADSDISDKVILGPHIPTCPFCFGAQAPSPLPTPVPISQTPQACAPPGLPCPDLDVYEAPVAAQVSALWSDVSAGTNVFIISIGTWQAHSGVVVANAQIDHGHGHVSYQMRIQSDDGTFYRVVSGGGTMLITAE